MYKKQYFLLAVVLLIALVFIVTTITGGVGMLSKSLSKGAWLAPILVISAMIDSLNPCAFSVLLLTIGFLVSLGAIRRKILLVGFVYIFGILITYLAIGLGLVQTLQLFNTPHFMAKVGAAIIVLFGLINLTGEVFPAFPIKLKIPQSAHNTMARLLEKGTYPTAFALGCFVGLVEFPCTGGPYLLVLGLLHDTATFWSGFAYLVLYNVIFVLPLVVMLVLASDAVMLEKMQAWKSKESRLMKHWDSIAMIILGLIIFAL
jgi:cytochrome c-type biogenesis protein